MVSKPNLRQAIGGSWSRRKMYSPTYREPRIPATACYTAPNNPSLLARLHLP